MDPELPIRNLDYTVVFARNMPAMREFYGTTLGFPLHKELGPKWLEFRVGSNVLALTERGLVFDDPAPPHGGIGRCASATLMETSWKSMRRSSHHACRNTRSVWMPCPRS